MFLRDVTVVLFLCLRLLSCVFVSDLVMSSVFGVRACSRKLMQMKAMLASELRGHVREVLESPHANHVLQRSIEVMCPSTLAFVLTELLEWGRPVTVARHRYGWERTFGSTQFLHFGVRSKACETRHCNATHPNLV